MSDFKAVLEGILVPPDQKDLELAMPAGGELAYDMLMETRTKTIQAISIAHHNGVLEVLQNLRSQVANNGGARSISVKKLDDAINEWKDQ